MVGDLCNVHVGGKRCAAVGRGHGFNLVVEGAGAHGNDRSVRLGERLYREVRRVAGGLHGRAKGFASITGDGEVENVARAVVVPLRVAVAVVGAGGTVVAAQPCLIGLAVIGADNVWIFLGKTAIGGTAQQHGFRARSIVEHR